MNEEEIGRRERAERKERARGQSRVARITGRLRRPEIEDEAGKEEEAGLEALCLC